MAEDTVSGRSGEGTAGESQSRNDGAAPSSGDIGFKDPDKDFVVDGYKGQPTVSFNARGEWQPKIVPPQGNPFEIPLEAQPEYPHNKVTESTNPNIEERHRSEVDDTKGGERVTINHYIGTAVEMWNEGELIVNSFGKMVQLVGENFEMFVAGNGTVIYKGDLDFTVEGDMHLKVKGDMQTTVFGNKTEIVHKKKIEDYRKDHSTTVVGNKSSVVSETDTEIVLGNKNNFVSKKQSNWVEGDVEFLSGANTHISSQTKTSISSTTVNMTGSTVNIAAGGGTIGGPAVFYYGLSFEGNLFVDGNLTVDGAISTSSTISSVGDISTAAQLKAANDITAFDTSVTSPAGTVTATETTIDGLFNYTAPTAGSITTTLTASEEGIMQVNVDPGDKIKQTIDLRERLALGLGL